jgi:hypothetical protein
MDYAYKIDSDDEVRALLRCIVAGKFNQAPSDPEVLTSKFVARIANDLLDIIKSEDYKRWGQVAADRWMTWEKMDPNRPEWVISLKNCGLYFGVHWSKMSESDKSFMVKCLFSPYKLTDDLAKYFSAAVDDLIRDK